MVQPDCIPSGDVAHGVLLIAVSGREVGVVCGREEQNDEKVFSTPRSVLLNMLRDGMFFQCAKTTQRL